MTTKLPAAESRQQSYNNENNKVQQSTCSFSNGNNSNFESITKGRQLPGTALGPTDDNRPVITRDQAAAQPYRLDGNMLKKPWFIVLSPKTTIVSKETHTLNKLVLWNSDLGTFWWKVGDSGN